MFVVVLLCSCVSGCADSSPSPPSEVVGPIVDVRRDGSEIAAFTVEGDDGRLEVWIADDVAYGFDLEHVQEHADSGDPVRCALEERDGRAYALSIADG